MKKIPVSFRVEALPDTQGCRIRTTDPKGLYLSSKNREAAHWYFECVLIKFLQKTVLKGEGRIGGLGFAHPIPWNMLNIPTTHTVDVSVLSVSEARDVIKTATPNVASPPKKLRVSWWKGPSGRLLCLIDDNEKLVDRWLMESVKRDLQN